MASDGGGGLVDGDEGWERRARPFSDYATPPQPQLQMLTSSGTVLDHDRTPYGTGGKWRTPRKSGRRPAVPYERAARQQAPSDPQVAAFLDVTSAQTLAGHGRRRAWLSSGISKILSSSATYLYSSLFRRRLPAPEPVLDVEGQLADSEDQISSPSADVDTQAGNVHVGLVEYLEPRAKVPISSLSDLDKLLKKKTLSRDEFDRLTALLQARVVSNGVEKKQPPKQFDVDVRPNQNEGQPSVSNQSEAQRWRQDLQKSREERDNGVRSLTVYENGGPAPTGPVGAPEDSDSLESSPVEVAIAFMGGRSSRQSGSTPPPLEPLSQRDENRISSGHTPLFHTPLTTLMKFSKPDLLNEDSFHTPPPPSVQSWGRKHPLSRTPYSRPPRLQSSRERAVDGTFGTPSATRWTPIRTPVTGGREILKRRSTVLEEGWPSGGPIRRTRQKAILSSSLTNSRVLPVSMTPGTGTSLLALPSSMGGKLSGVSTLLRGVTGTGAGKDKTSVTASGNFYVPAQSSETARKILETLEKMTPSPKGKSLGEELAHVRDRPPVPLTEGMLNEQARKSMTVIEHALHSESREPGPSGRSMENESPTSGFATGFGIAGKALDYNTKGKGKGKASLLPSENGPGVLSGLDQERTSTADRIVEEPSVRAKIPDSVRPSEIERSKGFRMNAVLEESGSEDESRLGKRSHSSPPLPVSTPKFSSTFPASSTVASPVFGTPTFSPAPNLLLGISPGSTNTPAVETSKTVSTVFSFPTRASLEGPPTPKAMSPASSSPKAVSGAPFFSFAQGVEQMAASGLPGEQKSLTSNIDSQTDSKAEFSFGFPSTPAPAVQPKLQPFFDSKVPNLFKQSAPDFGVPSAPCFGVAPAATSTGATSLPQADSLFLTPSTTLPKASSLSSTTTLTFPSSVSSPMFGSANSLSASGGTSSTNLFASNGGPGTAPTNSPFASNSGEGTSAAPSGGISGFGRPIALPSKSPPTTFGASFTPDSQVSAAKDDSTPVLDSERPQKRSSPSFQQDPSKRQPPLATVPSHSFTSFGTGLGNSASITTIPVNFSAASASAVTSQAQFSLATFGQAPGSAPQASSGLSIAGPVPFAFSAPLSTAAGSISATSLSSFNSSPSFPSFTSPAFGAVPSGSAFGVTSVAPVGFGSTPTTTPFASTTVKPVFGAFGAESVSQAPPTAVFGSGFTSSPSTTPAFSFGASSTGFSFGAGAASSSGSGFTFGSSTSFPYAGNKSSPTPAQTSMFGLSSSVPAFGSTTNGAMASDVVVNDQSNMDDNSMAEEPPQIGAGVLPQPSLFGAQSTAGTGSFVFGAQTGAPVAGGPSLFGGFPAQTNSPGFAASANPFAAPQPSGSLDFAGGSFTLGSGGDKPTRKIFKAKRSGAKRGK